MKNSKPSLCGDWSNCNIDILSYEFRSQLTAQTFCCLFLFLRLVFLYYFTKKKKKGSFVMRIVAVLRLTELCILKRYFQRIYKLEFA